MSVSLQRGKRLSGTDRMQPLATAVLVLALGYWLRFYGPLPSMLQDAAGGTAFVIFWILILAAGKPSIPARRATALVLVVLVHSRFFNSGTRPGLKQFAVPYPDA